MKTSLIHTIEKPEKDIFIYGLCDPDTYELKYIGLATIGFNRIISHYRCGTGKKPTRVKSWIKNLRNQSKIFKLIYLEYFDTDGPHVDEAEIFWIAYFKSIGSELINHDLGGRTEYLKYNSNESRFIQSLLMKETWKNPEFKQKQSEACKKANGTPKKKRFFSQNTKEQWANPEIRAKRIEAMQNKPRTEQQKKNMILGNTQRFQLVDDLGNIYPSLNEAARQLEVGAMVIHRALKNQKKVKGRTLTRRVL